MSQHPFYSIDCPDHLGSLLLTPCPGTKDIGLKQSLVELKNAGASAVLTLMLESEIYELGVTELKTLCEELDMQWIHLPIVDEGAPEETFELLWSQFKHEIHAILNDKESIAIHCKGGSGRTGIVAGKILLERGANFDSTIEQIKALRPNAFSHDVQVEYMMQFKG
ncbi:protein-tyrosine phosphatase family protein [Marinicellulosiphila megalodicopiae]|uniref:phosphatase domain-containing putative toxin n=1 Tax=Marinicellulosiphila megalodicopiae TaxID=2724896 RepID=UPI003BAE935E